MPSDAYSNRASSITPTNQAFLESIGAWRHLDLRRIRPYDEMQVWDGGNDAALQFDWKAESVKYNAPLRTVATMTENANLVRALLNRLEELGVKDLFSSTTVEGIENGADEPDLNLSTWPVLKLKTENGSQRIAARLLVGADGINSPVRTFAGINTMGWDYHRHGVVATLKLEPTDQSNIMTDQSAEDALENFLADEPTKDSQSQGLSPSNRTTAYQRFLPAMGGPIAILPLPNNHASLVWSTTPRIATMLKSLPLEALTTTINAALRLDQVDIQYLLSLPPDTDSVVYEKEISWRLKHISPPNINRQPPVVLGVQAGSVASFPLRLRNATSYIGPRIALAGDAAHTIHPLAGQGLNLGLGDAEALARNIVNAIEHGMDAGDMMTLEGYGSERYRKAVQMSSGVDILNSLYQLGAGEGIVNSALSRARGLGMWAINQVPGLKEAVMRRAE